MDKVSLVWDKVSLAAAPLRMPQTRRKRMNQEPIRLLSNQARFGMLRKRVLPTARSKGLGRVWESSPCVTQNVCEFVYR